MHGDDCCLNQKDSLIRVNISGSFKSTHLKALYKVHRVVIVAAQQGKPASACDASIPYGRDCLSFSSSASNPATFQST